MRNVIEVENVQETGTVDKLAFIRLNGPPLGLKSNKKLLKAALNLMFKDGYSKHFIRNGKSLNITSKVVNRITESDDNQLILTIKTMLYCQVVYCMYVISILNNNKARKSYAFSHCRKLQTPFGLIF